ncbi:hypothetical protein A2U01_0018454, partial [Trifolium medium]|nr:hypothetical protein [Trifolium medium]
MSTTPSSTSTLSKSISSTSTELVELNTNTQLPIKLNSTNEHGTAKSTTSLWLKILMAISV